jgi:hypothetical protein
MKEVKIKRMGPKDVSVLLGMLAFLIVPWFIAGLNIWGWMAVCVAALVICFEIYSIIKNDKTISRIFWEYKEKHPIAAWIVFGIASIGWILLGYHLLG